MGVAVSDRQRTLAFPREAFDVTPQIFSLVAQFVIDEEIDLVIVGRPLSLGGRVTASTEQADAFRAEVGSSVAPIEVIAWDERLTTSTAHALMAEAGSSSRQRRSRIDSASAVVLLQSFLDAERA